MGIFGGVSNEILTKVAMGIASHAATIHMTNEMDENTKAEVIGNIANARQPTSMEEVIYEATVTIKELELGWFKKIYLLGMIYSYLTQLGVEKFEANYIKNAIDLQSR